MLNTFVKYCDIMADSQNHETAKDSHCEIIPYECLRQLPRRPLEHLTNLFNHCIPRIKAEIVKKKKKCFAKAGFGESDAAEYLEEASKNIAAISNLCLGKELSCDAKDCVRSDDPLATHYSCEPATALLAVRNTQNEDVEDEEEKQPENRIIQRKSVYMSEVMQFTIDSNSSSHFELLYTVKDCIQKDMNTKKWKQVSLLDLWKKSQ
jgi:hypothetical protein